MGRNKYLHAIILEGKS